MISHFKLKIKVDEREEWADADKVFALLLKNYTKVKPDGKMPMPYEDKVESFFANIDEAWENALYKAYPAVDIEEELKKAKMWLISNTKNAKSNLKKFVNNWMAKAMENKKLPREKITFDGRAKHELYKPPEIAEEDLATQEEIREMLKIKR